MLLRRRVALVLAARALVAIAAAGCGGGDQSQKAATTGIEPLPPVTVEPVEPPPPPPTPPPPPEVKVEKDQPIAPGSRGDQVAALQEALTLLGYKPGKADGAYGPQTRKAIIAFQKDHNLEPDGIVGPKTAKLINKELAKRG